MLALAVLKLRLENGGGPGSGVVLANPNTVDDWCTATLHEVMANRYDRAVYRPWTIVSEPSAPPEGDP